MPARSATGSVPGRGGSTTWRSPRPGRRSWSTPCRPPTGRSKCRPRPISACGWSSVPGDTDQPDGVEAVEALGPERTRSLGGNDRLRHAEVRPTTGRLDGPRLRIEHDARTDADDAVDDL